MKLIADTSNGRIKKLMTDEELIRQYKELLEIRETKRIYGSEAEEYIAKMNALRFHIKERGLDINE